MNSADLSEFVDFTERQYPIDYSTLHTLGQLVASTGPFFIVQAFGTLTILIGAILMNLVINTFMPESTVPNYSFGFIGGGAFSLISNQFANSQSDRRIGVSNSDTGSNNVVTTTTVAPTLYSVTCGYSASGLNTGLITSAKCILTLADGTTEDLTIASPYTGSVTTDKKFTSGGVTSVQVVIETSDSGVPVTWQSTATAVSVTNSDVTTTPSVTNQGVSITDTSYYYVQYFHLLLALQNNL